MGNGLLQGTVALLIHRRICILKLAWHSFSMIWMLFEKIENPRV